MNIRTLLRDPNFPACLRCGKHLTRLPIRSRQLRLLAAFHRIHPFSCEGCRHRFLAVAWPGRYLEWDGQILVMPGGNTLSQTLQDGAIEFFLVALFLVLLCAAGAWSLLQSTNVPSEPHATTGTP
ncbi:MAG: hypothetical protein EPO02_06215 [Nitrospirae bacterium]|nr:MAG: hypothetical protein EPO02_06215 [Nitrospirota bacterium]